VRREALDDVADVIDRWELAWAEIGVVTDNGLVRAFHDRELEGELRASFLTDECPRYEVEQQPGERAQLGGLAHAIDPTTVYEQYDQLVGSRTVRRPGLDAAVLRLTPSYRGLAVSLDGPPPGETDPYRAGARAVLEAARNVACVGGEPLGLTDCLNVGNPEKAPSGWELAQAIEGIAEAAEALGIPVVSGNVSLYNETAGRAIPPTPFVGCVGLVPDVRRVPRGWRPGDVVLAVRQRATLDLEWEAALVRFLWGIAPHCTLVHDVPEGRLEVALAEAADWSGVAVEVETSGDAAAVLALPAREAARAEHPDLWQIGVI